MNGYYFKLLRCFINYLILIHEFYKLLPTYCRDSLITQSQIETNWIYDDDFSSKIYDCDDTYTVVS